MKNAFEFEKNSVNGCDIEKQRYKKPVCKATKGRMKLVKAEPE
jgi:hypothetical protein